LRQAGVTDAETANVSIVMREYRSPTGRRPRGGNSETEGRLMNCRDLLAFLCTLDDAILDKPVRALVNGQALVITRIDEGDGDDPPITGVVYVDMTAGCE
jgi:hypothetical protein